MAMRTDYQDFVPETEHKHYQQISNDDGTVSLVDQTTYLQEGDTVNAALLNELSQNAVWPLTHSKSGTVHTLTGLPSTVTGTVTVQFKATAAFKTGDKIKLSTKTSNATIMLSNGETPEDNLFVSGASVSAIIDVAGNVVNFKSGAKALKIPGPVENLTANGTIKAGDFVAGIATDNYNTVKKLTTWSWNSSISGYASRPVGIALTDAVNGQTVQVVRYSSFSPSLYCKAAMKKGNWVKAGDTQVVTGSTYSYNLDASTSVQGNFSFNIAAPTPDGSAVYLLCDSNYNVIAKRKNLQGAESQVTISSGSSDSYEMSPGVAASVMVNDQKMLLLYQTDTRQYSTSGVGVLRAAYLSVPTNGAVGLSSQTNLTNTITGTSSNYIRRHQVYQLECIDRSKPAFLCRGLFMEKDSSSNSGVKNTAGWYVIQGSSSISAYNITSAITSKGVTDITKAFSPLPEDGCVMFVTSSGPKVLKINGSSVTEQTMPSIFSSITNDYVKATSFFKHGTKTYVSYYKSSSPSKKAVAEYTGTGYSGEKLLSSKNISNLSAFSYARLLNNPDGEYSLMYITTENNLYNYTAAMKVKMYGVSGSIDTYLSEYPTGYDVELSGYYTTGGYLVLATSHLPKYDAATSSSVSSEIKKYIWSGYIVTTTASQTEFVIDNDYPANSLCAGYSPVNRSLLTHT